MGPPEIRALTTNDMPAVLEVQASCHAAALLEPAGTFLGKLHAYPRGCIGGFDGTWLVGYAFCHPWIAGEPVPLSMPSLAIPRNPTCMYWHDVAVRPAWQGRGVASVLVDRLLALATDAGLARNELVAVGGAEPFWERHGFTAVRRFDYAPGIPATFMARATGDQPG